MEDTKITSLSGSTTKISAQNAYTASADFFKINKSLKYYLKSVFESPTILTTRLIARIWTRITTTSSLFTTLSVFVPSPISPSPIISIVSESFLVTASIPRSVQKRSAFADPVPMSMMSMMFMVSLRVVSTNTIMILLVLERTPPVPSVIIPIAMIISILVPIFEQLIELASSNISNSDSCLLALTRIQVGVVVIAAYWLVVVAACKSVSDQKKNLDFHL